MNLESRVQVVADEIERYCIAHPEARDTVDEISWWVQLQRQEDLRQSVPRAIELLLAHGILKSSLGPDGAELYGFRHQSPK
jgi:hypothetical protein